MTAMPISPPTMGVFILTPKITVNRSGTASIL
nr:MAG TPA: hypothetical protein [Caudoviricetes sp.]DAZ58212.1 MAG TPA: hypothetical protein [Caudoviricetes sp.]